MNNLDKIYNVSVDIRNIEGKYNSYAKFFDDDRKTSIIRVRLLNNGTPINLEGCIVEAYFVLANNSYHSESCKIVNSSEGEIELELCQECLVIGENIVRISISKGDEIANTPIITYSVKKGLYSDDPNFNNNPLTPILNQMLLDVKVVQVNQEELQKKYEQAFPQIEAKINEANDVIKSVNDAIASGTQDLEVKEARDGEATLKARLDRDIEKAKQVYVNVEGSNISTDSSVGYLKDVEMLGNTIQDENNLADIRSVGDKLEGQELYKISVLCTNGLDSKDSEYKEDKLTILSPVQLERVGDVADRIIEKDGVWGVEKNVTHLNLFDISWSLKETLTNTLRFGISSHTDIFVTSSPCITNIVPYNNTNDSDTPHIRIDGTKPNGALRLWVNKADLATQDVDGLIAYLKQKNAYLKYILATPTFIPLPHDQQIKLRTFANKTNISFGCEIEGTIKAQVPKSLGATVNTHTEQIRSLNNELNRVKKLEESTVSTVTTESDFTTVEAISNGYFEDVKLEGKTLVNLCKGNVTPHTAGNRLTQEVVRIVTDFTVINTSDKTISITINKDDVFNRSMFFNANTSTYVNLLSNESIRGISYLYENGWTSESINEAKMSIILLEGDHTQNPPSYFEGLKSVGEDTDEIVVSSVKGDGNLFDGELEIGTVNSNNGTDQAYLPRCRNKGFIAIKENLNYSIKVPSNYFINKVFYYGSSYNYISNLPIDNNQRTFTTPSGARYLRFAIGVRGESNISQTNLVELRNTLELKCGELTTEYTPHISDKKRLLYYNEETQAWEKPILRQWDSIEKHADGKHYYHQRSGEVVLNGSENWDNNNTTDNYISFYIDTPFTRNQLVKCDKFTSVLWNGSASGEFIWSFTASCGISIAKSKLSTQDVQGFKQWLQANNVTVVYQLAQEKVYECTNIDLITYANETNYVVSSGVLSPRTTLKVHNNISNVVSLLQKKVSLLESNITNYMITQNRLMLASRYNADTVSFKVDVASFSDTFEYDNDLYELILNNILVGKDNYNREYIENLTRFYWMDFIISDEMYSTLFEIIEEQHNPKVIEEETPLI